MENNELLSIIKFGETFQGEIHISKTDGRRILHLCKNAKSVTEMMLATGYESRTFFRRKLSLPLLEARLLMQTQADRKNSPQQKYIIWGL